MTTVAADVFHVSYVRPESHQLFFLFVGVWEPLTIHTLDFMRNAAIGDRNMVILKDPYGVHCYWRGLSDEYSSLDGIVRWQQEQLATRFPHVREVFCVGTSAGASAALHTACRLRARAAWSLAGRVARADVLQQRERVASELYQTTLGRPALGLPTPEERAALEQAFGTPEVRALRWQLTGNPATVVAQEQVAALVDVVRGCNAGTDFHFYYATTNAIDRQFAETFRCCPRAALYPITPPPSDGSTDIVFRDPDHGIVAILHKMGRLGSVFSAYL